jgi:multicomponent K+:H+ antiporter subunit E
MKRWFPYPLLWALLIAMWLALAQSLSAADVLFGGTVASFATLALRALELPKVKIGRMRAALELVWLVLADVVRSNVAVGRIVLSRSTREHTAGFVRIPLELQHPVALAALACIITSTPGTSWARYDAAHGVRTMHILDLVDEETWMRTIKDRYERRLLEIFQ